MEANAALGTGGGVNLSAVQGINYLGNNSMHSIHSLNSLNSLVNSPRINAMDSRKNIFYSVCLVCAHRCHNNHLLIPIGFDVIQCQCCNILNNKCNAMMPLALPNHIKVTLL